MIHRVFSAEVQNGKLRFDESLADLEGHRVRVVLDDDQTANSQQQWLRPQPELVSETEIESEMLFAPPFRREIVTAEIRDGGWMPPCLIFDEEICDE